MPTFNELKQIQKKELQSKVSGYYIYRHVSTPFTWFFVKFKVNPNLITIGSMLLCFPGFFFLMQGSYQTLALGLLFFILFKILDMADGETARVLKKQSIEGVYFDRFSHYLYTLCLGLGLGTGLEALYQSPVYLYLGFLFATVYILENVTQDLTRDLVNSAVLSKRKESSEKSASLTHKKILSLIYGKNSWGRGGLISKCLKVVPAQGLFYSDTFTAPLFLVMVLVEGIITLTYPTFFGFSFSILSLYFLITIVSKSTWITWYGIQIEKKRPFTNVGR